MSLEENWFGNIRNTRDAERFKACIHEASFSGAIAVYPFLGHDMIGVLNGKLFMSQNLIDDADRELGTIRAEEN